ncbi:FAD/NAD(P)-binding domain-containing protein [Thozetella sp. PMI_491]|nr:FAD/NAD(P)-binding domain-containing protein [Thozetella sp. PMI_491]
MNNIQKVIIIGGGPAGLLAALRLQQAHRITPVIYEIRPQPTTLGGSVGIPPNGLRLLSRLGLYESILAKGAETPDMLVHSLKGEDLGQISMISWSKHQTGFGYVRVRRTDLVDVLLEAIGKTGIPIHNGKHLVGIEEKDDQVLVSFSDGAQDSADLLLGCDGIHSAVRRLHVDSECVPEYSGIANMYSLISASELPPTASALKGLNTTLTSDGLIAISPTSPNGDLYWFFSRQVALPATEDAHEGWEERGKQETETWKSTLLGLFGPEQSEWNGVLRSVVEKTESIKFYPIYKVPTNTNWFKGHCLLLGDAAHAMPPHASQGVSMALEDVFLLSKMLEKPWGRLEDGLREYEQKRKARTKDVLHTAEQNGTIRQKTTPWGLWAKEKVISGGLHAHKALGLDKMGLHQKYLVYDVENEQF